MTKHTLLVAVAAIALLSPLAIGAASAQQSLLVHQAQYQDQERAQDRDRGENARDGDHRDRRESWRDDNRDSRWDDNRHNGYYQNGRWIYGPPSADRRRGANVVLGYRPWAVGQSLGYYNNRFTRVDYRREQLRAPPRRQHWVRDDRGDYLLINRSGRIMQVVVSGAEPRDRRQSWRDARNDARWDDGRHNGYYRNNQWTYGAPPEGRYGRGEIVYGYQPWERGQRLGYYEGRYAEVDYRTDRRLSQPPRGYHWVRNDKWRLFARCDRRRIDCSGDPEQHAIVRAKVQSDRPGYASSGVVACGASEAHVRFRAFETRDSVCSGVFGGAADLRAQPGRAP